VFLGVWRLCYLPHFFTTPPLVTTCVPDVLLPLSVQALLRDLPEPVVTFATYDALMAACTRREGGTATDADWASEVTSS